MESWKSLLRADPTDWLLEESDPSVRYFTLRWLLDRPEDDQEVISASRSIAESEPVRRLLGGQKPEGYWGPDARSVFLKLGSRRYLVISIVMVAGCLEAGADGTVARATVAVGACSEVAQRLTKLEAKLLGRPLSPALADLVRPVDLAPLMPISDVRASAQYRRDAALTLVRRALAELGRE